MIMEAVLLYLTKQNVLVLHDLREFHYQIFLIISQKEFLKLNVKIVIVFLNFTVPRPIQ